MPRTTRRAYSSMPHKGGVFDIPRVNAMVDNLRRYYGLPIDAAGPMKDYVINRLQRILDYGDWCEEEEYSEQALECFYCFHIEHTTDVMLDMLEEQEILQKYQDLVKQKDIDSWQRNMRKRNWTG